MVAKNQKKALDEEERFIDALLEIAQRGNPEEVCQDCLEAIRREGASADDARFTKMVEQAVAVATLPGTHAMNEFQVAHDILIRAGQSMPASWMCLGFLVMAQEYAKQRKQNDAETSEG